MAGGAEVPHRRSAKLTFAKMSTAASIATKPDNVDSAPCHAV